jgi:Anthrone oxygenase
MKIFFELITTLAAGLFTGAALFIHFVEHPARMELGPAQGVSSFGAMYKRAKIMQPFLVLLSFFSGAEAWFLGANAWWLIGSIIMVSLFPYTFILMLPLNKELTDPGLDKNSSRAAELLAQWGNLHKYRVLIGLVAFVIFLLLLGSG